jgi:hypothetical protein
MKEPRGDDPAAAGERGDGLGSGLQSNKPDQGGRQPARAGRAESTSRFEPGAAHDHPTTFPQEGTMTVTATDQATDKQVAFLRKLIAERKPADWKDVDLDGLTKREASSLITTLLAAPRPAAKPRQDGPDVPQGRYIVTVDGPEAIEPGRHVVYNLGNGDGYSVRQVVEAVERVTGRPIAARVAARRPGDPARLVASSERIGRELGWRPEHGLDRIVMDAWQFHSARST